MYETEEQKSERLARSEKNKNIGAVMVAASFPSASLLTIGSTWTVMSEALHVTSIIATILLSVGLLVAMKFQRNWDWS